MSRADLTDDLAAFDVFSPTTVKALFLLAGFVSLVIAVTLWFSGNREAGLFVGLWVPAIHSLGALVLAGR